MFNIRKTKPGKGNKFYVRTSKGGYSQCVKGSPTDKYCDVLANCVGYACGRFSEIYSEIKGYKKMKYPKLYCNAENFIEQAKDIYGLKVSKVPTLGGIMVWKKGTLDGDDGAGHVAIVEKIYDKNTIYTSESGYGSSAFWNSKRSNSNGRWGLGSAYTFRGCIINPAVGNITYKDLEEPKEEPKKEEPKKEEVKKDTSLKVGDKVEIIKSGNASKDGKGATSYGIGYVRYINKIYKDAKYPYKVGSKSGVTTGYYKKSALKKK